MARKTFISYKYSEATELRDEIIKKLGEDAQFYQGETADSPDMTGSSVEKIKDTLKNMIFGTSVTIVIVSPQMKDSNWISWEIEYSLKEITREDKTSRTNGIVGVIIKHNGNYDWLISYTQYNDGCRSRNISSYKLYSIINNNRFNLNTENKYSCPNCKTFNQLNGSYISLIDQDSFLENPNYYIENAFEKSQSICNYDITKTR